MSNYFLFFLLCSSILFNQGCSNKLHHNHTSNNTTTCNCDYYRTRYSFTVKQVQTALQLCADDAGNNNNNQVYIRKLFVCNTTDSIAIDHSIRYSYMASNDTLLLYPQLYLPLNTTYEYIYVSPFVDKVFYNAEMKLIKIRTLNPDFKGYSSSQILDVFEEYQLTYHDNDTAIIKLIDKLTIACFSRNVLAMKTFRNFEAKYRSLSPQAKKHYEDQKYWVQEYITYN